MTMCASSASANAVGRLQSGAADARLPNITLIYESRHARHQMPNILPLSCAIWRRRVALRPQLRQCRCLEMLPHWLPGRPYQGSASSAAHKSTKYANLSYNGRRSLTTTERFVCPAAAVPRRLPPPCGEIFIIMAQGKRSFVDKLDFVTSIGHVSRWRSRTRLGVKTEGSEPSSLPIWPLFEPDPETKEMSVVSIHPGVTPRADPGKFRLADQIRCQGCGNAGADAARA